MDLIEDANQMVETALSTLNKFIEQHKHDDGKREQFLQTQSIVNAVLADRDRNFDKIMEQQACIKSVIEKDGRINTLYKFNTAEREQIEQIRKDCAKLSIDSLKNKQDLIEVQTKEIERFQMEQMRSIVKDYQQHEKILDLRRTEIETLKKQILNEEKHRGAKLKSLEETLDKSLKNRVEFRQDVSDNEMRSRLQKNTNPDTIELATIDEYDLYSEPVNKQSAPKPTTRGRGRGARKRGGGCATNSQRSTR